jgi:glycosyltransferase involved in cell wall biosynthesis
MPANVDILLSTYNGEKYLPEQLESVALQDYSDWKLIIRDDGSTDKTIQIIEQFKQKYSNRVTVIKDNKGNLGYSKSFLELMRQSAANYIMFCDQDDYWYPNKISTLLAALQNEGKKNQQSGCLVFSDLQIADGKLDVIGNSFLEHIGYAKSKGSQIFFLKNYVPGCSLMFNKALLQGALKTENIIGYHDYWLIMLAASMNKIVSEDKPLMKYRTHDRNAVGVKLEQEGNTGVLIKDSLKYFLQNEKYRTLLYSKNIAQLQNICSVFPDLVTKEAKAFCNIDKSSYFGRKLRNLSKPYLAGRSFMEQLTYIICF